MGQIYDESENINWETKLTQKGGLMDYEILGEKILVKRIVKTETESGIIIPRMSDDPITIGEIVGIGNVIPEESGCRDLKVGDVIIWMAYAGTEFDVDGTTVLVIRPNDVVGKKKVKSKLVMS